MIRSRGLFTVFAMVITMSLLAACGAPQGPGAWPTAQRGAQTPGGMGIDTSAAPADQTPVAAPPVKVGLILPLSGPQAGIGQAMEQAAQLALFDMGYEQYELIPRDSGGSPQSAQRAAQDVINDGAQIVLGPLLADSARAVKTVTAEKNVPMITFSTDWTLAGGNSYVMGFLPFVQIARVAEYAASRGIRTVAYVAPHDMYGDNAVRVFEQEAGRLGLNIAGSIRYFGSSGSQLAGQLQTLAKTPGIQAVFIPVGGMKADEISSTLSFHGMTPDKTLRLGTGLWDDETLAARASMQGAVFAAPSPRQYAVFEAKYRSVYGSVPPRLASLTYDAVALTAVLARQGNPDPYTAQTLMNPNGFAGMDGIFRFNRNGMVERGLSVLQINNRQIREIVPAPASFVRP